MLAWILNLGFAGGGPIIPLLCVPYAINFDNALYSLGIEVESLDLSLLPANYTIDVTVETIGVTDGC